MRLSTVSGSPIRPQINSKGWNTTDISVGTTLI